MIAGVYIFEYDPYNLYIVVQVHALIFFYSTVSGSKNIENIFQATFIFEN